MLNQHECVFLVIFSKMPPVSRFSDSNRPISPRLVGFVSDPNNTRGFVWGTRVPDVNFLLLARLTQPSQFIHTLSPTTHPPSAALYLYFYSLLKQSNPIHLSPFSFLYLCFQLPPPLQPIPLCLAGDILAIEFLTRQKPPRRARKLKRTESSLHL